MKRIGIFGGSFDPPHHNHKDIIEQCLQMKLVDEVWVLPAFHHVQKENATSFEQRIKMCKIMFEKFLKPIKVKDFEVCNRSGATLDMVRILRGMFNRYSFSVIIGRDCAENIETWVQYKTLIQEVPFIVFEREHCGDYKKDWYLNEPHRLINNKGSFISSTDVRKLLSKGHYNVAGCLTSEKLIDFIRKEKITYENPRK
jgi:nicotinate (nicotinamide) nucleotide adenylyltransferase